MLNPDVLNVLFIIFLVFVVAGYWVDSRRNPGYYGEAFAFWILFAAGFAVIYVVFQLLLEWAWIGRIALLLWAVWLIWRLRSTEEK